MDPSLLEFAAQAAVAMMDPMRLAFLGMGVLMGLVLGVIPGLGGLVGLSLLLPFTFSMDPITALAVLMGLSAVTVTADTIPAVLFGVPGTVGSAATILDGFPMAKKGEAGRAFGAAFTASVIGGVFGAILLGISIPVLRPLMLFIESPELLAISVFGLSLAAVLSGGSQLRGLTGVCLGLLIATVGEESQSGYLRWTMDSVYLWDGVPVVPVALGLFAIPELADLAIQKKSIHPDAHLSLGRRSSQFDGVRDVFRNKFLTLRCATIGALLGAIPGVGATVIDWIAYGHAARTEKGAAETFGKGDVRGVIASESSNNAKEGGALVPTLAFGVPGSASMALILGALLMHGLVPGPQMLTTHLDVTYSLVWSIAIANILGAGICFAFAGQLAKIALIRIGILAPVVLSLVFVGAYQGSHGWGDLIALLGFGLLGWIMKRFRWPRPPLILGFVLGSMIERYMFISVERYGIDWLGRPIVMVFAAITLYGITRPMIAGYLKRRRSADPARRRVIAFQANRLDSELVFSLLVLGLFASALFISWDWDADAKLVPQAIAWVGALFACATVLFSLFVQPPPAGAGTGGNFDLIADYGDLDRPTIRRRAMAYFLWCLAFLGLAGLIGLPPAILIFLILYMRLAGNENWRMSLMVGIPTWLVFYLIFHRVLHVTWPPSYLGYLFPGLKSIAGFEFF